MELRYQPNLVDYDPSQAIGNTTSDDEVELSVNGSRPSGAHGAGPTKHSLEQECCWMLKHNPCWCLGKIIHFTLMEELYAGTRFWVLGIIYSYSLWFIGYYLIGWPLMNDYWPVKETLFWKKICNGDNSSSVTMDEIVLFSINNMLYSVVGGVLLFVGNYLTLKRHAQYKDMSKWWCIACCLMYPLSYFLSDLIIFLAFGVTIIQGDSFITYTFVHGAFEGLFLGIIQWIIILTLLKIPENKISKLDPKNRINTWFHSTKFLYGLWWILQSVIAWCLQLGPFLNFLIFACAIPSYKISIKLLLLNILLIIIGWCLFIITHTITITDNDWFCNERGNTTRISTDWDYFIVVLTVTALSTIIVVGLTYGVCYCRFYQCTCCDPWCRKKCCNLNTRRGRCCYHFCDNYCKCCFDAEYGPCSRHCRPNSIFPTEMDVENTFKNTYDAINPDFINSWKIYSSPKWAYWEWQYIQYLLDVYWWCMIVLSINGIFWAHIYPIFGISWQMCRPTFLHDHFTKYIMCECMYHIFEIPVMLSWFFFPYYGLAKWTHLDSIAISNAVQFNNITSFIFGVFETTMVITACNREGFPNYQILLILLYAVMCYALTGYGVYLQRRLDSFESQGQDTFGLYKIWAPLTFTHVKDLIKQANDENVNIRVQGSLHSTQHAIYPTNPTLVNKGVTINNAKGDDILMSLENLRKIVSYDDENKRITVQCGILLGHEETTIWSTFENSLIYAINKKGWGLSDLGGVIKQNVAGFTCMGCSGGTLVHDYYDNVYSFRLIDGSGNEHLISRDNDKELFNCIGVNMGLFGILTEITFQCEETYNVIGSQVTLSAEEWLLKGDNLENDGIGKIDFFPKNVNEHENIDNKDDNKDENKEENGNNLNVVMNLQELLKCGLDTKRGRAIEYMRFFWWPQSITDQIIMWKGHRMDKSDYNSKEFAKLFKVDKTTGEKTFVGKPYIEIGNSPVNSYILQSVISMFYHIFGNTVNVKTNQYPTYISALVEFISNAVNNDSTMIFGDKWFQILPMDQGMSDQLFDTQFTELWCDIEDTNKLMAVLKKYFSKDVNLNRKGNFGWEFYCARKSDVWLHPGYKRDSIRVDLLWFTINDGASPYNFYLPLWEHLIESGIDFRPHWAKWFPSGNLPFVKNDPKKRGFKTWADYYKSQYEHWDDFLKTRKEFDPNGIFVSKFWQRVFDIPSSDIKSDINNVDVTTTSAAASSSSAAGGGNANGNGSGKDHNASHSANEVELMDYMKNNVNDDGRGASSWRQGRSFNVFEQGPGRQASDYRHGTTKRMMDHNVRLRVAAASRTGTFES